MKKRGPVGGLLKAAFLTDVEAFESHHQPSPALRCRPEIRGEPEKLAERGKALHQLEARVIEDVFDLPPARAE